MKKRLLYLVLAVVVVITVSCSEYQKLLKSDNYELKYTKAVDYFGKGDYYRCMTLLDELSSVYRGRAEAEDIHYMMAQCYFNNEEYNMAAYYFKTFSEVFPVSRKVEECDYMAAYCFYLLSPGPTLDQTFTLRGIQELQLFLNRYPQSERRDSVNILVDNLYLRLETKAYNNAKMYFDIGDFKAAITSLKNVLIDYPDTQFREQAMYYIVKSAYYLAENSVEEKKKQRYKDTVEYYQSFVDRYPESRYVKEVEKIYTQSLKLIN
ncbi:MAG: outer membrane protein assembly factor BamD [Bacteroidales bacterium]|nr:outer membrane protein assembly factor BamD [Bacteroidales bacterium]HOY38693.1 outer membrane protein assembly factor BamD [Bacteroidales bacterium]HQP03772.1 outer membrane protein assembly factor BamD [Bacteroidales bacterium]